MDDGIVARLRRTAVGVSYGHAEATAWLEAQRVRVVQHGNATEALRWARAHPYAPHVVHDPGVLDRTLYLVEKLEAALTPRPVVLVVSPDLERGLVELGWRRSTYRVGFVRSDNLIADLENGFADLLGAEPPLPADVMDRERSLDPGDGEPRFDVAALMAEIESISAWAGGLVDRVGSTVETRVAIGEPALEGGLAVGWHDDAGSLCELRFAGALVPGLGTFTVQHKRGLASALGGLLRVAGLDDARFDARFTLHADEAGLAEARAAVETLALAPSSVEEASVAFERFTVRVPVVERSEVRDLAAWVLELWRVLVERRTRFGTP